MEETVFTKILKREIPAVILYEDDLVAVFLDRFPLVEGQTLVIPKEPVPYLFDVADATYARMHEVAKTFAKALDAIFGPRTCTVVEGFAVPHAHIRLYPGLQHAMDFSGMGPMKSDEELAATATKIRANLSI